MSRPRGPRTPLDPELAAILRQLGVRTGADADLVPRRKPEPPGARIQIRYVLVLTTAGNGWPVVEVLQRVVPPTPAKPGRWEPARVDPPAIERLDDRADRELLQELIEVTSSAAPVQLAADGAPSSRFSLSRGATIRLLPQLGRSGRLLLRRVGQPDGPLAWREEPWVFRMVASITPSADSAADASWDVHGILRSGDAQIPLAEIDASLDAGFVIARGCIARLDDAGAASWLGMLKTHASVRITPPRRAAFLEELYLLPAPPLDLPAGVELPVVEGAKMTPKLVVQPPDTASTSAPLRTELSFDYDGCVVPAKRPGRIAFDAARSRLVRRDAQLEAAASALLASRGVEAAGSSVVIPPSRLAGVVAELLAEGWQVEAAGRKQRRATAWSMGVKSGVDWLDLTGEVRFGGFAVALPRVLDALRRREAQVLLDDGSVGVLPEAWLAKQGIVLRLGVEQASSVRFATSQLPLLDALVSADPSVTTDEAFDKARAAVTPSDAPSDAEPSPKFQGELRPYQRTGLGWLRATERAGLGGLLADEMGLGKTIQVLAHLAGRPRSGAPTLIVAPRSLVFNWKREAARFAPHLRVLDHSGADRHAAGDHLRDHDLVLTTYGTLRRDVDALASASFDYVVLDEAQAIKNDVSDTARAARRLQARNRLALSGTPVENHLGELWSIVEFLNPGLLGRAAAWKATAQAGRSADGVALLSRALRPFFLRRTKAEVAPDLPARMDETWMCELGDEERALYEELRARFRSEILGSAFVGKPKGNSSARVLEALLRLRQAACHPGLIDPERRGARSAKLDALVPEIVALRDGGHKALVFSQFRTLLGLTRPALEAEGIRCEQLDGTTRDREALVTRFQTDPTCDVLLISLKAGGVGLNLTAAEYVFLLDPWWNPAAEAQAIDRAHRIGQTKPVFSYRLIAKDTVEERIAELQERKRLLADSVIRGDGAPLRDLSRDDLDRLLS